MQPDRQLQPHVIAAYTLFAEADKSSMNNFESDATGIANVIKNRTLNPDRFGADVYDVVSSPDQFTGYGGKEFMKAASGNMTDDEAKFLKKAFQITSGVERGVIEDNTGGADHYYNDKIAKPAWGGLDTPEKVKQWEMYYPETKRTSGHKFSKETLRKK